MIPKSNGMAAEYFVPSDLELLDLCGKQLSTWSVLTQEQGLFMKYGKSMLSASCLLASIGMAQAQSLGFISMSASVNAAGATAFGSGISATSHVATGIYLVTFKRDISQCVIVVTPRGTAGGQASVSGISPTKVRIYTFSTNGIAANSAFALIATCNS